MMLKIEHLNVAFQDGDAAFDAVNDFNLRMDRGEVVGVVGESGSGKSMMAHAVMGLLRRSGVAVSGKIEFEGTDLLTLDRKALRRYQGSELSIIFQEPMTSLNPTMRIGPQVEEALRLTHRDRLLALAEPRAHRRVEPGDPGRAGVEQPGLAVRRQAMGRDAAGVRGIRLQDDDFAVGAELYREGATILTVTERGYGKRTAVEEYLRGDSGAAQGRGGSGMKNYNLTPKTGPVAGICTVTDDDDVMLIESGGVMIRLHAADVGTYSRAVQGVIVMRVEEGSRVTGVVAVAREEEESAESPSEETPEAEPETTEPVEE